MHFYLEIKVCVCVCARFQPSGNQTRTKLTLTCRPLSPMCSFPDLFPPRFPPTVSFLYCRTFIYLSGSLFHDRCHQSLHLFHLMLVHCYRILSILHCVYVTTDWPVCALPCPPLSSICILFCLSQQMTHLVCVKIGRRRIQQIGCFWCLLAGNRVYVLPVKICAIVRRLNWVVVGL